MKFLKYYLIFLTLNLGALGLGVLLMGNGPTSEWYTSMNQAPWTPENWMFGTAWNCIMICFSFYMSRLYIKNPIYKINTLFAVQFILNVAWNYVFFDQHLVGIGLLVIILLTFIITVFLVTYWKLMQLKNLLIIPYFIWICIATSLNLYILIYN